MTAEDLAKQLELVWNAPAVVVPAAIALIVAVWIVANWLRSQEVRAAKEQVAAYKARLDGATPDEARARIQALEAVIKRTIGSAWTPLTKHQVQALTRELAGIEKRRIQIMYKTAQGKDLARALNEAFEAAGWDAHLSVTGDFEEGLFVGRSPTVAPQLIAAIERVTPLKPIYMAPDKMWGEDTPAHPVFIGVGTNPD